MTTLVSMLSKSVLYKPLLHIFNLSIQTGIFQMNLKLRVLLLYLKAVKIGT